MARLRADRGMVATFGAAAVSVAAVWATVTIAPSALALVLFCLSFLWGVLRPYDFFVMVLPCLLPLAVAQIPDFSRSGLAVALLAAVVGAAIGVERLKIVSHWRLPRLVIAGWLWILAAEVISATMAGGPEVFTSVVVRLVRTAIFVMAGLAISRVSDIRKVAMGWFLFGILELVAAIILQRNYGTVFAIRGLAQIGIGSVLGSSVILAAWGTFSVASAWGTIGLAMGKLRKWAWLFVPLTMAFAVASFYSGRRQALVAFAGSAVLFILMKRGWRRVVASAAICLVLAGSTAITQIRQFLDDRASVITELVEGPGNSGYMRISRAGVHAFLDHPLTGLGLGNYSSQTASEGVWMSEEPGVGAAPHNSVIRIIAETGLMGGLGVVLLLAGIVAAGVRAWRQLQVSGGSFLTFAASGLGGLVIAGLSVTLIDDVGYCFVLGEFVGLCAFVVRESPTRRADIRAAPWSVRAALSRAGARK